jgi:uncharacterized protein
MKITKEQLASIKEFVKASMKNNDPWHDIEHIKQTVNVTKYLAKKEGADINKCLVAAWLHDISKYKENKENKDEHVDHGTDAAIVAKTFLLNLGFALEDVDDICYAIDRHNKDGKKTKESKILWDADKLRSLGAYGVLNGYGYQIYSGHSKQKAYDIYLKEATFFTARFNTRTGKQLVKKYMKIMTKFNKQYQELKDLLSNEK